MCEICGIYENSNSENNIVKNKNTSSLDGVAITSHTASTNEVKAIEGGVKWNSVNLDVSFATTSIAGYSNPLVSSATIENFSTNVKNGIIEIFNLIDDVCALNFNFLSDGDTNAEILLWETTDPSALGVALHGGNGGNTSSGSTGDIFCDVYASTSATNYESNFSSNYGKGSDAFYTWVHEIGHALGLGHTHDTGFGSNIISGWTGNYAGGSYGLNYGLNTVMSYNAYNDDYTPTSGMIQGDSYEATGHCVLGAWDIYALQQKYGANTSHNNGNNTYTLNDFSWGFQSIWDTGGTDTISHAGESTACVIDLTAATLDTGAYSGGGWSYTASKTYGISIANGVVIENANGGNGNDSIVINSADNIIDGNGGTDYVIFTDTKANVITTFGFHHNNTSAIVIEGTYGTDTITDCEYIIFSDQTVAVADLKTEYASSYKPLFANATSGEAPFMLADTYTGGVSGIQWQYLAQIGSYANTVVGSTGNDFINLLGGDDAAVGGAGDDILDGGRGSNFLTGGDGTDTFFLDGRGSSSIIWSTITDWDNSEQLSVWGWNSNSTISWEENQGTAGYTGATFSIDLDGDSVTDMKCTFTGFAVADIKAPTEFEDSSLLWFV